MLYKKTIIIGGDSLDKFNANDAVINVGKSWYITGEALNHKKRLFRQRPSKEQ